MTVKTQVILAVMMMPSYFVVAKLYTDFKVLSLVLIDIKFYNLLVVIFLHIWDASEDGIYSLTYIH